jgi:hypothetical protein
VPILLSEAIPLATTDKVDTDGKYTTTTPSSNDTKGWYTIVNTRLWKTGFRRDFQIESFRDIQKDQNILVASFRMAADVEEGKDALTASMTPDEIVALVAQALEDRLTLTYSESPSPLRDAPPIGGVTVRDGTRVIAAIRRRRVLTVSS